MVIKKETILIILFCFSTMIVVILLSFKIVLAMTKFSPAQQNTINFLDNAYLELPYTEKEILHLQDVKKVMIGMNYFFYSSLLISTLIVTYYQRKKDQIILLLKWSGITTIVSVVGIIILLLLNFTIAFTAFHSLFFPQGNWIFPADSLLIQTFPLDFFKSMSMTIFGLSLVIGFLMICIKKIQKR